MVYGVSFAHGGVPKPLQSQRVRFRSSSSVSTQLSLPAEAFEKLTDKVLSGRMTENVQSQIAFQKGKDTFIVTAVSAPVGHNPRYKAKKVFTFKRGRGSNWELVKASSTRKEWRVTSQKTSTPNKRHLQLVQQYLKNTTEEKTRPSHAGSSAEFNLRDVSWRSWKGHDSFLLEQLGW